MFVINGHHANGQKNAECRGPRCKQTPKPDKIASPPSSGLQQGTDKLQEIQAGETNTANIISFAAAMQNAEQLRIKRLRQARFQYPMLECE